MEYADSSFEPGCWGRSSRRPVVMKFGGTSVADAAAIRRLLEIVLSRASESPIIVVSAMAGVTDELLALGRAAAAGESTQDRTENFCARHLEVVGQLVAGDQLFALQKMVQAEIESLRELLAEMSSERQLTLRSQDRLLSVGECLSSQIVVAALHSAGIKAVHIDARNCILTNDRHGEAGPLWEETNHCIRKLVGPQSEAALVPVLGGFIAATRSGVPTTLGRGGSDFTAAIVGAALFASRIEIWTDVDGIMTTDPNICPDAHLVPEISFDEAAQLAYFGAKVLHPATLVPAVRENIPVYVRNSRNPKAAGTKISHAVQHPGEVDAIAAKHNIASLEIKPLGPIDSELLASLYSVLDRNHCTVELMSCSRNRLSLLVSSADSLPAVAAELEDLAEVGWENHKALICLVGESIRRKPEVAQRIYSELGDTELHLLPQSGSENSMSFLVEESRAQYSVQRLHNAFFSAKSPAVFPRSKSLCQAGESWL